MTTAPKLTCRERALLLTALTNAPVLEIYGLVACPESCAWLSDPVRVEFKRPWVGWLGEALVKARMINAPVIPQRERGRHYAWDPWGPKLHLIQWYYPKAVLMDGVRQWVVHQKAVNKKKRQKRAA